MSQTIYGEHGLFQLGDSLTFYEDKHSRTAQVQLCDEAGNPTYTYMTLEEYDYCVVLIVNEQDEIYLTEQVKTASLQPLIEAVAGGIEPGQTAEEAAITETLQEAGITVKSIVEVGQVFPQTHRVRTRGTGVDGIPPTCKTAYHFVAKVGCIGKQQLEELEKIKLLPPIALNEAVEMCLDGRIQNSDTVISIFRYLITRFDEDED